MLPDRLIYTLLRHEAHHPVVTVKKNGSPYYPDTESSAQSRVSRKRRRVRGLSGEEVSAEVKFRNFARGRNLRCQRHEALGLQIYGPGLQTRRT